MRPGRALRAGALALAAAAAVAALPARAQDGGEAAGGELRLQRALRGASGQGPLAEARRLAPGLAPPPRDAAVAEAHLRGRAGLLSADAWLRQERSDGGGRGDSWARFNELYAAGALPGDGAWQWSAGRQIVSWDVGYAWRPNDVVQQAPRRLLLPVTPQGRALVQLERFGAETAWSLVAVNPQQLGRGLDGAAGGDEPALALRAYRRVGAADLHGVARWGERTHASLGAALAWVASDALELHGSVRALQAHDGVVLDAATAADAPAINPWRAATLGGAGQWLLGLTWTGASQWSLLLEAWHDGTAPADADWDAWRARGRALAAGAAAPGLPEAARRGLAGQLAWQATPWNGLQNLRRDNAFARLSWQHGKWQPALDLLWAPRDGGRTLTATLAWQGDRWRLEGGLRRHGGPAASLAAQLPLAREGFVAATWAF